MHSGHLNRLVLGAHFDKVKHNVCQPFRQVRLIRPNFGLHSRNKASRGNVIVAQGGVLPGMESLKSEIHPPHASHVFALVAVSAAVRD